MNFLRLQTTSNVLALKPALSLGLMMPALHVVSDLTYLIVAVLGGLQVIAGRLS